TNDLAIAALPVTSSALERDGGCAGGALAGGLGGRPEPPISLEKLPHQAIDLVRVLVGGPVAGARNPVHVERADRLTDLADQEIGGPERGVVLLTPEQSNATGELREVAEERPAA